MDNGYAVLYRETREALKRIGTEAAWKIRELLGTLEEHFDDSWSFKEEKDDDDYHTCENCGGSGSIDESDLDDDEEERDVECDECGGSGSIEQEGEYYTPGYDQAERIDDDFYAINQTFVNQVEDYVRGRSLDRVDPREDTSIKATCRYPNVKVKLIGNDGNTMVVISSVSRALRRAGIDQASIDAYVKEAMSGDYHHVLSTTMDWVVVE